MSFAGSGSVRETLERMGQSLRHRGPDAQGIYEESGPPSIGLVHRRLSVIDLSHEADQPLPNENGTVRALLNGEVYNFQELRRDLEQRHAFRSRGDTEVIVHLYEERGVDAICCLEGMFAVALWDSGRHRLLLARDHFGKKPLYYWTDGRRLVFGSEIKSLLAADVPAEVDEDGLEEYLAYGYVPTPRTLFKGILKVPPAAFLLADSAGVSPPQGYWDLCFPQQGHVAPVRRREAEEEVRSLLTTAVQRRLVADVPLGILLSGGVDSAAVAALASRSVAGPVKTFTVGFEGDAYYDERPAAAEIAGAIGSQHHASLVTPRASELVETLLDHYDEPFGDSSALPTYLVSCEARKHVTVVLNGDGGDETFAGYDRFGAALLAGKVPARLRTLGLLWGRVMPEGGTYHGSLRRLRRFMDGLARPAAERFFSWVAVFDFEALGRLLGRAAERDKVLRSYADVLEKANGTSLLSQLLYLNSRTYLLDDLLPKMDRMTMAHGLEARSPFLDRRLVEYVAGLPDSFKRRGMVGKLVLKEALKGLVPPSVLKRPKHGFGVPLGRWFRGELRPMVQDLLLGHSRLSERLRQSAIQEMAMAHFSGSADRGHQLWTLLTLELWLRKYA